MYRLSDDEIEIISNWLSRERLTNNMLEAELLDHICCMMETDMHADTPLAGAYQRACRTIFPEGARQIEEEAFFLLTYHKQVNMKRILFSTGFLSTFLLSSGLLLKLMRWSLATPVLTCGLAVLFVTLGALVFNTGYTLRSLSAPMRVRIVTGLLCGLLIVTGSLLKILHYPGANIMLVCGLVLLNLVFLPMFFYQLYRRSIA